MRRSLLLALLLVASLALAPEAAARSRLTSATKAGTDGCNSKKTVCLAMKLVTDVNADGRASFGDTITWQVTTGLTKFPYVGVSCYQSGTNIYNASAGFYDGYSWPGARNMILDSYSWVSGAASCTADMYYADGRRTKIGVWLKFEVGA